jgi:hypothetical protein
MSTKIMLMEVLNFTFFLYVGFAESHDMVPLSVYIAVPHREVSAGDQADDSIHVQGNTGSL